MRYNIICVNIGNPSIDRAKLQLEWLLKKEWDILVLTEFKKSKGGIFLEESMISCEMETFHNLLNAKDYGVLIISRVKGLKKIETTLLENFNERVVLIENKEISIMGIYVPSNDKNKLIRKKPFVEDIIKILDEKKPTILCGDFNTVTKEHVPKYKTFKEWEYNFMDNILRRGYIDKSKVTDYSWFGRTGNKYKYDYLFHKEDKVILESLNYNSDLIELKLTDHCIINGIIKIK